MDGNVVVLEPDTGWSLAQQENGDYELTPLKTFKGPIDLQNGDYVVGRATTVETGHLFRYLGKKKDLVAETANNKSVIIPSTIIEYSAVSDFIEQGSVAVFFDITTDDFKKNGIPVMETGEKGVTLNLAGKVLYNSGGLRAEIVEGILNFDFNGDFAVDLGFFSIDRVRTALRGTLDLNATLLVSANQSFDFSNNVNLFSPITIPVRAVIAGVPVWIDIVFKIKGGFDLYVGGGMLSTAGFEQQSQITIGAEYSDGTWHDLTQFSSRARGRQPTLSLDSSLDAKLYVRPELQVVLYSAAVPYLAAEPYLGMEGNFGASPYQVDIDMGVDAIMGFSLQILTFTLADWNTSYTVWHRPLYTLYAPVPPTAQFSGSPRSGQAPLSVHFTDQSTTGSAAITSWSWNFGDGGTSTQQNPNHTYSSAGSYNVSLTVGSSAGVIRRPRTATYRLASQAFLPLRSSAATRHPGRPHCRSSFPISHRQGPRRSPVGPGISVMAARALHKTRATRTPALGRIMSA